MRAAVGVALLLLVGAASHLWARVPVTGRDSWPLAGVTWMITRPGIGAEACSPGTEPAYIGPNMVLEIYATDNYGGYPPGAEILVDEVEVPPTGYVRWTYPMRPGTQEWVRCRTRQTIYHAHPDAPTDTTYIYGCWSEFTRVEVPAWATRWGTIDDVPAVPR